MKIGKLEETLKKAIKYTDRSIYIEGPIGVGKTETINRIAEMEGYDIVNIPIETMEFYDFKMNKIENGKMRSYYNEDLPDDEPVGTYGLLVFEDLTASDRQTVYAVMNFLLTGKIGNYVLPKRWKMISTGNREEDGILTPIPKVVKTRMLVLTVNYSVEDFSKYILKKYKNSKNAMLVASYAKMRNNVLVDVTPRVLESIIKLPFKRELIEGQLGDYTDDFLNYVKSSKKLNEIKTAILNNNFKDIVVDNEYQFLTALMLRTIINKAYKEKNKALLTNIYNFAEYKLNLEVVAFIARQIVEETPEMLNMKEIVNLIKLTGLDKI